MRSTAAVLSPFCLNPALKVSARDREQTSIFSESGRGIVKGCPQGPRNEEPGRVVLRPRCFRAGSPRFLARSCCSEEQGSSWNLLWRADCPT